MTAVPEMVCEQPEGLVASIKVFLKNVNEEFLQRLQSHPEEPNEAIRFRTDKVDSLLKDLYRKARENYTPTSKKNSTQATLMAQGGYGRRELCLYSDIDVLVLHDGKSQEFVKHLHAQVFQVLWDAGLEVGFAVRTVKDCRQWMEKDLTVFTSLLDARYLAGDNDLFDEFRKMFERYASSQKSRDLFLKMKAVENKERGEKFGGSIYLLEPNLKEGDGGLRDYHNLHWLGRLFDKIQTPSDLAAHGYLTQEELASLWKAVSFLWRVRNELHRKAGRRLDQLLFDYQEPVAHALGFENTAQFLGVETFMQHYYKEAAKIRTLSQKGTRRLTRQQQPGLFPPPRIPLNDAHLKIIDGRLTMASADLFEKQPLYLLKTFEIARRLKLEIDDLTKERMERNLHLIDDAFRTNPENTTFFRSLFLEPMGLGEMLTQMNDLGILGEFLPEFKKLHFRVQHDIYHVYTVDVHLIFAVMELGKLYAGLYEKKHPTLHQMVKDIEKKDILSFAIFYHDIGKGEGRGHVEKGAPIIRAAGERLGFTPAEQDVLEFLERSHLIMTHVAFRRDLEDQQMIIQFAKAMRSPELLNMLYILTFCDVKAVSAEAMTDWKASLIEYLYLKTREVLEKGDFTKERASTLIPKALDEVLKLASCDEEVAKCRTFFSMMPTRYLLATPASLVMRHVRLWEKFDENPIVFETRPLEREGLNEVTIFTWESLSLFSKMTGIFAAHNINITEAQLTLSTKGHALQSFKVSDHEDRMIDDPEKWVRVERDLRDVLEGRAKIDNLVAEKFKPSFFKKKVARVVPTRIDIDNDISGYYTVIDVYTQDRVGLLYQITSTLSTLGLYVDVSKISTKVDQVADTFYVKDIFGHKVTSQDRLNKIRDVLKKVIEEEPSPGWRPPVFTHV